VAVAGRRWTPRPPRTDVKAILVIFCALIAMAVYFISGWTPLA
jgi:hypothetical protein